jgi:exosome complex RNA-binding protein Rrp42 (RNase PH superfamily)
VVTGSIHRSITQCAQVGVKPSGAICAIQKDGHGALAPAAISAVVQIAGDAAAYVFRRMAEEGEEDEDGNDGLMLADD